MEFYQVLNKLRVKGLELSEIASKADIPRSVVSKYTLGINDIPSQKLHRIIKEITPEKRQEFFDIYLDNLDK